MQEPLTLVWLPAAGISEMIEEASRMTPLETGGALMGYSGAGDSELVITDIIGPGPKARHRRTSFMPDLDFQRAEIACKYAASSRLHTYIGDWHTHPGGTTGLSRKDKNALLTISAYPDARVDTPLMAIVAGDEGWSIAVWQLVHSRLGWIRRCRFAPLKIKQF